MNVILHCHGGKQITFEQEGRFDWTFAATINGSRYVIECAKFAPALGLLCRVHRRGQYGGWIQVTEELGAESVEFEDGSRFILPRKPEPSEDA